MGDAIGRLRCTTGNSSPWASCCLVFSPMLNAERLNRIAFKIIIALDLGSDHQAPNTLTEITLTGFARAERDDDAVHLSTLEGWQFNGESMRACAVDEDAVWELDDPALRTADLCGGLVNGALVPALPRKIVISLRPCDGLVAEDEDVVAADHKKIAQLLPITLAVRLPIDEHVGIGSQVQKAAVTKLCQVLFRRRAAFCPHDGGPCGTVINLPWIIWPFPGRRFQPFWVAMD